MAKALFRRECRTVWLGRLGAVLLMLMVGQVLLMRWGDGLARWSYDIPFLWKKQTVPEDLVMVYVDAEIKRNLDQPPDEPLDRRFYVSLLDRLTADGAKLVLFDILFDYPHPEPSVDRQLAEAMRRHGNVVLVGEYVQQWQGNILTSMPLPPIPVLQEGAAGWGLASVNTDPDVEVRHLSRGTELVPSAAWVAAQQLSATPSPPADSRDSVCWVNYYCDPTALRAVNLDRAIDTADVGAGLFHDAIVVVGSRGEAGIAGAERDTFRTPYALRMNPKEPGIAPGAAIQAFSLLNLHRGDWLTRLGAGAESLLVAVWGVLLGVGSLRFRPLAVFGVTLAASGLFTLVSIWVQARFNLWFNWLVPAAVLPAVALVWSVGFQYTVESRRRQRLRRAFAAYLSPHMADAIAESDFDLSLGGKEVEASIMFTDLEGFTAMSEQLTPTEVSRMLTGYFSRTTQSILEQDGTVIKYVGDAVMAVWGAPLKDPQPAQRAVLAAIGMQRAGQEEIDGRRFRTRIGINTGLVLAGNLGSEFRFDYTLIGAATNAASRLESLNKRLGTDILISESTRRGLEKGVQVRPVGRFQLSGTRQPMSVYEVLWNPNPTPSSVEWIENFSRALANFDRAEFDTAERLFLEVIHLRGGEDGPSRFYLGEISSARGRAPGKGEWHGVIRLSDK